MHTHRFEVDDVDCRAERTEGDYGSPNSNRSGSVRVALQPGEMAGILRALRCCNSARRIRVRGHLLGRQRRARVSIGVSFGEQTKIGILDTPLM